MNKLRKKIREFKCNTLDWHKPIPTSTFDGVNLKSRCRYCNKVILKDSQGNWFSINRR